VSFLLSEDVANRRRPGSRRRDDDVLDRQSSHSRPGSRVVISWSNQPLPSGSLNSANAKYERPSCASRPGVGRRELQRPKAIAAGQVGVQPPSEALIEALCPIDIGDGQRHNLEFHVHD
jgi:hypothetical protein